MEDVELALNSEKLKKRVTVENDNSGEDLVVRGRTKKKGKNRRHRFR